MREDSKVKKTINRIQKKGNLWNEKTFANDISDKGWY